MRTFDGGATRDGDDTKLDFEGFFSPYALEAYAEYLNKHRKQADGQFRDSDNWQKGIPISVYMKSAWRHFFDLWKIYRGHDVVDRKGGELVTLRDAACGVLFNVSGLLHEFIKSEFEEQLSITGTTTTTARLPVGTQVSPTTFHAKVKTNWKSAIWPDPLTNPPPKNTVLCDNCVNSWVLHSGMECPDG